MNTGNHDYCVGETHDYTPSIHYTLLNEIFLLLFFQCTTAGRFRLEVANLLESKGKIILIVWKRFV